MTNDEAMTPEFNRKLKRLNALTELVDKINEASLGENPQMVKEYSKIKKLAMTEMRQLNADLVRIANQNKTSQAS